MASISARMYDLWHGCFVVAWAASGDVLWARRCADKEARDKPVIRMTHSMKLITS